MSSRLEVTMANFDEDDYDEADFDEPIDELLEPEKFTDDEEE